MTGITPIGRMGGKSKLARQIINKFPDFKTYVEPFLGAGNIFLRMPYHMIHDKQIILNDIDFDIYFIFSQLQKHGELIEKSIQRTKPTKEEFEKCKIRNDVCSLITKYKYSFFCRGKNYAPSKNYGNSTDYMVISNKLQNTLITNSSFENIIELFDNSNTFFYLDPPYENSKQSDYHEYVTPQQVLETVKTIKGKFLLSYNDSPLIRELFKDYKIETISTHYSPVNNLKYRSKNELLISNY
jgi:DNA adenine methylase